MIQVKKNPWYIHYVVGLYMLMTRPIKFLTIGRTNKKYFIDSYWELKKIKQEWDKEFEATQNSIDKDKLFIEKTDKWINKINNLVQKYGEKFYDAEVE
jgi:hypothetical protein